jgi:uncharacterized protein YidB (DUF937 family)
LRLAIISIIRRSTMGLLDGVLGGVVGAGVTQIVTGVIERHGGVAGLVSQFEKQGLGSIVQSWVGTGANQPISAAQVQQVVGSDALAQLAAKFGLQPADFAQRLAQVLPQAVDKLTPDGVIPKA